MRSRSVVAAFVLLTALHTWPIGLAPWRESLNHNADAQYAQWSLSWVAFAIANAPSRLFDGNIFAPEPRTLAFSEPTITPALVGAPLIWLGLSPVLVYNLLLLAGLLGTGLAGWWLVRTWTGSPGAGLVAGALAAYNVHLLTRLPHLMAVQAWTFPLILLLADRLRTTRRTRDAVALAVVIAATAANSLYALAFAGVLVAVVGLTGRWRPRGAVAIATASLAGVLAASPVLLPYVRQAEAGMTRPIEMVADFSATPAGYVTSTSRLHDGWTRRWNTSDVDVFFAGAAALLLAALGAATALRSPARRTRRRVAVLLAVAAIGVVLSLGPATGLYRWLYEWALPLQGLRAASRFGYLFLFAVAILAGYGVAWLQRRWPRRAGAVALACLAVVTIEAWHGPVPTTAFDGVPAIYQELANAGKPVMLVEVPFFPPDAVHQNGPYVLNASAHLQPVMNGHSGFTPMSYRRRAEAFWFFPEPWAIQAIRDEGATHVMVHLELFQHEAPAVVEALLEPEGLWLVAADARGHLLYEVR